MVTDNSCFCHFDIHCDFFQSCFILCHCYTRVCFQVCSLMILNSSLKLYKFRLSFSHIINSISSDYLGFSNISLKVVCVPVFCYNS